MLSERTYHRLHLITVYLAPVQAPYLIHSTHHTYHVLLQCPLVWWNSPPQPELCQECGIDVSSDKIRSMFYLFTLFIHEERRWTLSDFISPTHWACHQFLSFLILHSLISSADYSKFYRRLIICILQKLVYWNLPCRCFLNRIFFISSLIAFANNLIEHRILILINWLLSIYTFPNHVNNALACN